MGADKEGKRGEVSVCSNIKLCTRGPNRNGRDAASEEQQELESGGKQRAALAMARRERRVV